MTDERPPQGGPESNTESMPTPAGESMATPPSDAAATPPPAEPMAPPSQPMSAYTPPSSTPPPVPPPAMPQPAVAWAPPAAMVPVQGQRTTLALAAGILLMLLGVLGALLGLLIAVVGGSFVGNFKGLEVPGFNGDPSAMLGSAVAFVGIVVVVYSLLYIIGGVGVVRSRNWGRVTGIIVGILSGLVWLSSLMNSGRFSEATDTANGGPFALVLLVIHLYIVVTLLLFWRTKGASTA